MNPSKKNKLTKRKVVLTSASTVVLLSAMAPVVPVFASERTTDSLSPNNFSDVYISNVHADAIRTLAMAGIAKGYPDNTFAPYEALTMSDVVKFMGRYIEKHAQQFDLAPVSGAALIGEQEWSDQEGVKYANLMNGYALTDVTTQQLTEKIGLSREHTAALLVNFINKLKLIDAGEYVEKYINTLTLGDLDQASYAYQDAIQTLSYLNVTNVDYFKPKDITTRAQFASFLVRTIDSVLENPNFKDDLFSDYLFDDVHIAQDGSKIFGSGALPKSTIVVKEEGKNIIGATFVGEDSNYDLELVPNLKDGARIAIEMTDHVNNKMTFEKVVRVASTDASSEWHVANASADVQEEEMQFDFMMGGNMAYPMTEILEQAVRDIVELDSGNYTLASWEKVQEAVSYAQQILLDWEASEDMLNEAFDQLEQAVSNLESEEVQQTTQFSTVALDTLVMKLLEVQKDGFTDESYDALQNTILKAIVTDPSEIANVFNELVTVAANLQLEQSIQEQQYENTFDETAEDTLDEAEEYHGQTAINILQKALQAVAFKVKQLPMDGVKPSSIEQINQSIQFSEETLKQNANTHELTFAFTNIMGSLMEVKPEEQDSAVDELLLILNAQIDSSSNLMEEEYSAESWDFLEQTIHKAKTALTSRNADEIRATIESIQYAIYQLTTAFYEESINEVEAAGDSAFKMQKLSAGSERSIVDQTFSIIDFNEVEVYELKSSVQTLLNDILYVVVSEKGQDVFSNALWTDFESRQSLDIAVKAARHAMYQEEITVDELQATKTMLEDKIELYDFSKKSGLVKSTTALAKELEEEIEAADKLLKETESDENGEYVSVEFTWATQAMHDQLNEVTRQSVLVSSSADASLIRAQLKTLEAAVDGFLKQCKIGKMAMTYSPDALNMNFDIELNVASVTYDEHGVLDLKKMAVESKPVSNISLNDL